jgi:hypothetical protein
MPEQKPRHVHGILEVTQETNWWIEAFRTLLSKKEEKERLVSNSDRMEEVSRHTCNRYGGRKWPF